MPTLSNEISLKVSPSQKQNLAWIALLDQKTRYLVWGGGGGGGKSFLGCEWLLIQSLRYPGIKSFMAREKLKTTKMSTLLTFFKVAAHHKLKRDVHFVYHQQESFISFPNGSRIDILELKFNPSDPMFEDLGSLEYTIGWIEEAGEIDVRAFDTIKTRIGRQYNDKYNLYPKLLMTCNPKKNWLYTEFYKPWKEHRLPEDTQFIQSLVDDNPFIESDYKQQLMSIKDPIKRQRLLLGDWEYDSEAGTLFEYDAIADLWSNTVVTETSDKTKYLIVDVARFGKDKTVFNYWEGWTMYKKEVFTTQGTDATAEKIREACIAHKIAYRNVAVDEDGVGGGVVDQCKGVRGFQNNSSALPNMNTKKEELEKQNFQNLKSQCTYLMAEAVNNHEIAITVEDPEYQELLMQELEVIRRRDVDNDDRKLGLISKDDIKQIIGRSPDYSDTFIMRMYFTLKPEYRNAAVFQEREKEQRKVLQSVPFNQWGI